MNSAYYATRRVVLYHADASDALLELPRSSVDLLCTDPPYGQEWRSNRRTDRFDFIEGDDGTLDISSVLRVALPALRRGRHVYVFGPADLTALPLTKRVELIWDKEIIGPGDLSCQWGPAHEPIQFSTYESSAANRAKGYGNLAARLRQGSVLRCQRLQSGGAKLHPTEKPVALMRQIIESSSVIGETVLDPFAGVGSTLVAAALEGRRSIGIEIDERYCAAAAERLATVETILDSLEDGSDTTRYVARQAPSRLNLAR